jgi:hypothetical protein
LTPEIIVDLLSKGLTEQTIIFVSESIQSLTALV